MKRIALLLASSIPLIASAAHAQSDPTRDKDSIMAVEIRFGPYRPNVDEGPVRNSPYSRAFGDDTRYMIGGEVDWQAFHIKHVGSLGLGGMFGYTRATANAQFADGTGPSAEDTTFSMWLFQVLAVARIDVLARETWVPIVPYVKVGPGMALWTAGNGSGTVTSGGVEGKGRTYGMIYTVGGMFLLDSIDRQAAKTFAAEQGVKHTYFFFEYMMAELKGLGQSNAMWVGDRTWQLGLAMEL
jgi:hypothetical protein